jgi:7-carboxy-7-deazaguanine synthase
MSKYTLPVSEQFHSLQGEGPTVGIPSYFLRLKSCNLLCGGKGTDKDGQLHDGATWRCDTVEVWLKGSLKPYHEIISDFGPEFVSNVKSRTHHLVITGGEPLLYDNKLGDFLAYVNGCEGELSFVEVETNGTIIPEGKRFINAVSQWNVSPKLANSGVPKEKRIRPEVIKWFAARSNSVFKFVVGSRHDVFEAIKDYIVPFNILGSQVYFMPAADNEKDLQTVSQDVAAMCIESGLKFTTRLHVAIWNRRTGV